MKWRKSITRISRCRRESCCSPPRQPFHIHRSLFWLPFCIGLDLQRATKQSTNSKVGNEPNERPTPSITKIVRKTADIPTTSALHFKIWKIINHTNNCNEMTVKYGQISIIEKPQKNTVPNTKQLELAGGTPPLQCLSD